MLHNATLTRPPEGVRFSNMFADRLGQQWWREGRETRRFIPPTLVTHPC